MAEKRRTGQQERPAAPARPPLADEHLRVPALAPAPAFPVEVREPDARQQTPAGQRVSRPDGRLHGLGQTRYIADLALPGMLHAKITGFCGRFARAWGSKWVRRLPMGGSRLSLCPVSATAPCRRSVKIDHELHGRVSAEDVAVLLERYQ